MRLGTRRRSHAVRVAAAATAVVAGVYVVGAVALDLFVVHRLTAEADARIGSQLADVGHLSLPAPASAVPAEPSAASDVDDAPIFLWQVSASGAVQPLTAGAPALPRHRWSPAPVTLSVGTYPFRFDATRSGSGWLVAGQSAAEIARVRSVLLFPEVLFGLLVALASFVGALVVGLRASAPIDLVRRRQAEFTADASHELRTPLSVIEAEADLALRRRREPEEYEDVLHRIAAEGRRLRRIVDDLLWLARADGGPVEARTAEAADVASVVAACAHRFRAVAERRGVSVVVDVPHEETWVHGMPEWIDRLAGVLIDNACKYAGEGGTVEVRVRTGGHRVELQVDDSGPGIPPEQRLAVLDRFRRATDEPGGAGLGLAIADSVVRMTEGSWSIGEAPLGGARMQVWWRRSVGRRAPWPAVAADGLEDEDHASTGGGDGVRDAGPVPPGDRALDPGARDTPAHT